jgi:alpha-galactosidase/6-phospho-beta-glucosidase family protein
MPFKVTIIGGGSSMFVPLLLRRFLAAPCMRGGTVALMDVNGQRLEVMASLARALVASEGAELAVESTLDQRESLTGADFVIVAIAVGGMPAWEDDIEIPGRYGVFMHIADSIGPGGMLRAFRNLPVIESICHDLAEVSPGAWVFNYTNPASAVAAVLRDAPAVRSASLCSCTGAPSDPAWLAELAGVEPGEILAPVPVAGLNHCAGITELRLRDGRDAMALVRARAEEPAVRWIIDTFGMIPYCWAHWVEFFPQLQRLEEPYAGRAQGLAMSHGRHIYVMDNERARAQVWNDVAARWSRPEHAAEVSLANLPSGPEDAGIEVVDVIQSLVENRGERYIVNVRNGGAIPNLPDEAIVEVQAVVDAYGIRPVATEPLRDSLAAHLYVHWATQELTVRAALSGDRQLALEAFLLDPLLAATLTAEATSQLLDEMLAANAALLPRFA